MLSAASSAQGEYYKTLRVSSDVTLKEIKKSYHQLALKMHPDRYAGREMSVEETERLKNEFQMISRAYEVLGDRKLRSIYDRYGDRGLLFYEQTGSEFLVKCILNSMRLRLFISSICLFLLAVTSLPMLAALKITLKWTVSWGLLSLPLWIALVFGLLGGLAVLVLLGRDADNTYRSEMSTNIDGSGNATSASESSSNTNLALFLLSVALVVVAALVAVQLALLVIKLDNYHSVTWYVTLFPLYIVEIVNSVARTLIVLYASFYWRSYYMKADEQADEKPRSILGYQPMVKMHWLAAYFCMLHHFCSFSWCRLGFIWLLGHSPIVLDYTVSTSWVHSPTVILMPLYLYLVLSLLMTILCDHYRLRYLQQEKSSFSGSNVFEGDLNNEDWRTRHRVFVVKTVLHGLFVLSLISTLIMLNVRLVRGEQSIPWSVVFLFVWIFNGIILLIVLAVSIAAMILIPRLLMGNGMAASNEAVANSDRASHHCLDVSMSPISSVRSRNKSITHAHWMMKFGYVFAPFQRRIAN